MFAFPTRLRYRGGMMNAADFSLAVVANVCDGPAALRARLVERGLDLATIARLVRTSPLTLARATKTGASPRGVLVGLATLVTVLDRLEEQGVAPADLLRAEPDPSVRAAAAAVADQGPLAAGMVERLLREGATRLSAAQLSFDSLVRAA
jgi:hypothetical protein